VSDIQRAVGVKIASARKAKGWKQKHLAAAVDVEPVTISRWETGAHMPPVAKLFEIAAALEIPTGDLVTGIEEAAVA
jgi:transcriptional regulator with XRE-family HTH domain